MPKRKASKICDGDNQCGEITFLINDEISTTIKADKEVLATRSTLLKGLFECCDFKSDQTINLILEKPEKFGILLLYLTKGRKSEELLKFDTFASYINDIIYLGLEELEKHAMILLTQAIIEKKVNQIDFNSSLPNYDFMEKFMHSCNVNLSSFGCCELVLNWLDAHSFRSANLCMEQLGKDKINSLTRKIFFEDIQLRELGYLCDTYSLTFDDVVPASVLLQHHLRVRKECVKCGKVGLQFLMNSEPCFKNEGYGMYYTRNGFHVAKEDEEEDVEEEEEDSSE